MKNYVTSVEVDEIDQYYFTFTENEKLMNFEQVSKKV